MESSKTAGTMCFVDSSKPAGTMCFVITEVRTEIKKRLLMSFVLLLPTQPAASEPAVHVQLICPRVRRVARCA